MRYLISKDQDVAPLRTADEYHDNGNFNLAKSDLIPSVVHELKNPISAIIALSDLLNGEMKNVSPECLEYLHDIQTTAKEMNELVHDLLDANSKSDAIFSVDLSNEININEAIKRAVKINRDYAIRRKINLKVELANDPLKAKLDDRRMRQILSNLISNAIKYSNENSEIIISAKITEGLLTISVKDQGFGMTPRQLVEAFMKYKTISNPNSKNVDSFGIGLPITKHLVELQKGIIEAKSEIGKGTEIILKFCLHN